MNQPAGPYEMNPIRVSGSENYTDFRAKPPEQTAFEKQQQESAFHAARRAREDAEKDADELLGDGEPQTAFEVEMLRGRRPLGATPPAPAEEKAAPKAPTPPAKPKQTSS